MHMHTRHIVQAGFACLTAATLVACSSPAAEDAASEAPAPAAEVAATPADVGIRNVSILHLNIEDMDRSLAFYQGVLGMETVRDSGGPSPTPIVADEGAMMHTVVLQTPGGGFSMELVEVSGVPLQPQHPRIQDPGEIMLAMQVKDLNGLLASAKGLGLEVLSEGDAPVVTERPDGVNRAVMVQDADGFIVEFVQNDTIETPIGTVAIYLSVASLDQTVAFYNQAFGMGMETPAAANATTERVVKLFDNAALATMRTARGTFPGTEVMLNFQEFTGADQDPVRHRVQDPGGPIFTMTVEDFPATIERIKASGGTIGQGDASEMLAPDARFSWIRDPNGLLIRVSAPPPAAS